MVSWHLVVGDDLVIPIDDVDAAIGAVGQAHGAEEGIVAGEEVGELFEAQAGDVALLCIAGLGAVQGDGLHFGGDGVGDGHDVSRFWVAERSLFDQRQSAQARAAHAKLGRRRKVRLIALLQRLHAPGVVGILMEGHDGVAVVVGLLDEGFTFAGEDEAPDIVRADAGHLKLAAIRAHAGHAALGVVHHHIAAGFVHFAVVKQALRHPDPAAGSARELMRKQVRVLHAEAGQNDLALVRFAIAIGVFQQQQVVTVQRVAGVAIAPGKDAQRDGQTIREDSWVSESTRGNRRIHRLPRIDEHLVLAPGRIHGLRCGGVLVRIHRILQRRLCPQSTSLVKVNTDEFADAVALLNDELDFIAISHMEFFELLLCGQSSALGVVVTDVAFRRCGGIRLRLRRRGYELARGIHATEAFPSRRARCGRQLFDRHILHLHQAHAATVHLRADEPVQRDVLVRLNVVHAMHAVDPGLNARPFGADAVLIPAKNVHRLVQCRLLFRGWSPDDLVAAELVINFAEPSGPAVHLIARHVRAAGHAQAANLDAAVEHAGLGIAADLDLELQLKVLIALLGADEVVLLDLLRGGASGDHAILHAPDFGIVVPAFEGLAIKDGNRLRVESRGEEEQG